MPEWQESEKPFLRRGTEGNSNGLESAPVPFRCPAKAAKRWTTAPLATNPQTPRSAQLTENTAPRCGREDRLWREGVAAGLGTRGGELGPSIRDQSAAGGTGLRDPRPNEGAPEVLGCPLPTGNPEEPSFGWCAKSWLIVVGAVQAGESISRGLQQFMHAPDMICDPRRYCRRHAERFVDPAEIIEAKPQRNGGPVVFPLAGESVRKPCEPARAHADTQIGPLDNRGADALRIGTT